MEAIRTCTKESTSRATDLMLFRARESFEEMEGWVLSAEAMRLAEHEVEEGMERRGREVHRLMLQAHLNERGDGCVGGSLEVVTEGEKKRYRQKQRRDGCKIISIFGKVEARRAAYGCAGEESIHPIDEQMQLSERAFSYEMQQRMVGEAVRGPFEEAVESMEKQTGRKVSKRSAEEIVLDAAKDFDAFYQRRTVPSSKETGPILVSAADGKGIPMVKPEGQKRKVRLKRGEKPNKKKMATVAAVFTQQRRVRTPLEVVTSLFQEDQEEEKKPDRVRPEHKRVWASLTKSKEEVIQEVVEEARRRDPGGEKKWVVVTDGERGLQNRVTEALPEVLLVLDLLHVLEKLWKVAHVFYQDGSQEAADWVRSHALMILQGRVSQVIKGMKQSATKRRLRAEDRKTIDTVSAYFRRNRSRMEYHNYLEQGLPIASGAVEGACKHLIKDRMERSGMRWTMEGAEAMLKLRALKLSNDLEAYWKFHIQEDQKRLYGGRAWCAVA
jgi:hypothetical protein